jgi:regulator of RNase E activity RraA
MSEKLSIPDAARLIERFQKLPTGVITDAFLRLGIGGWMDEVLPLVPGSRIVGRARTVAFGPIRRSGKVSQSMYALMSRLSPGDILVIGSGGTHDNLLGENMGTFAHRCGLAGIVTDSKTRDRNGLRELGMPVFSRGAGVRPPIKVEPRAFDVALDCGRAQVRPGDILFQIEDLLTAEERISKAIKGGATLEEIEAFVSKKKTPIKHSGI